MRHFKSISALSLSLLSLNLIPYSLPLISKSYADTPVQSPNNQTQNTESPKPKAEEFMVSPSSKNNAVLEHLKSVDGQLAFCSGNMKAKERLSCYEDLAKSEGVDIKAASFDDQKEVSNDYKWGKKIGFDLNQQQIVLAGVETSDVLDSFDPTDKTPPHAHLNLRCRGKNEDLYLSFDKNIIGKIKNSLGVLDYPSKPFDVKVSFGTESKTYPFTSGNTGRSVGLWGRDNSGQFINYLYQYASETNDNRAKMSFVLSLDNDHKISANFSVIDMGVNVHEFISACQI